MIIYDRYQFSLKHYVGSTFKNQTFLLYVEVICKILNNGSLNKSKLNYGFIDKKKYILAHYRTLYN